MWRELGVPEHKMRPAIYLAFADMVLGMIPVVGTLIDIFLQPSRRTLKVINEYVRSEYGVDRDLHLSARLCTRLWRRNSNNQIFGANLLRLGFICIYRIFWFDCVGVDGLDNGAVSKWAWSGMTYLFHAVAGWF